jgi:N-acetylmuramoyl-L-alanine amidase
VIWPAKRALLLGACVWAALTLAEAQEAKEEQPSAQEVLPEWIHDRPITFGAERIALMKEYALLHYGMDDIHIVPKMIVIHWTGGKSFKSAFNNFNKAELTGRPYLQKFGKVNVAAHYLVDRDGKVYKLMPDTLMGRHVIGLNHCSLGVENVGNNDLTGAQLKADARLVGYLAQKHDTIEFLIGHHEYLLFENHPLFVEKVPGYRTKKKDPGKTFMKKLRALLSKEGIELQGPPP